MLRLNFESYQQFQKTVGLQNNREVLCHYPSFFHLINFSLRSLSELALHFRTLFIMAFLQNKNPRLPVQWGNIT